MQLVSLHKTLLTPQKLTDSKGEESYSLSWWDSLERAWWETMASKSTDGVCMVVEKERSSQAA